jgi:hypothetical protein
VRPAMTAVAAMARPAVRREKKEREWIERDMGSASGWRCEGFLRIHEDRGAGRAT